MAEQAPEQIWRGWHVITRFLPMLFLGSLFVIYGLSPWAPHVGRFHYGVIFAWIGGVLLLGALVGILFTKCPICYQTNWVFCSQEPDVVRVHDHGAGDYYMRDLAWPEDSD